MRCLDANEVVRFLDGAEVAGEFEDHVDRCTDCRALVTELGRALDVVETTESPAGADWEVRSGAELVDRGTQVDRYVVLEVLGAGAMGVVYRAYDPELDRDIALKLVRELGSGSPPEQARGRLLREAQAMARLAHPNVVAVHDASIFGSHVFVAMELVEGVDLEAWLVRVPRSWHEIAGLFVDAGRGLAAAHRAGIVHRDFKPSNVLVGTDGRVRVTDFGLAVVSGAAESPPAPTSDPESRITTTGTVLGTPAYMSPEVRAGRSGDDKSDQYSFAVALHEAVVGKRPVREAPLVRAPARLRALLERGLATSPGDRFPTMDALVDALVRARAPRIKRGLAVAAVALLGLAAYGGHRLTAERSPGVICEPPTHKLAGIWDPPRKAALRDAFAATKLPHVDETWRRVEESLDNFASTFTRDHVDACEATHVRHEQSDELLDLRMACLAGELARLGAVTSMFATADADVVRRSISAADLTDRLAPCRDVARLRDRVPLPVGLAARTRLELATNELARIETISMRGRYAEAVTGARQIVLAAEQLGYARLEAAALVSMGESQWRSGDLAAAEQTLHRAVDAAKRARAPDLEAGTLLTLVAVIGVEDARYAEALRVARLAESTILAIGDDERLGKLIANRASIYYVRGELATAAADYKRAAEILERVHGPEDRRVGQAIQNLAMIAANEPGDGLERSLPLYGRALAILERKLGPRHPEVALALANRAIPLANLGRYDEAVRDVERALAIRIEQGPGHREVAVTHRLFGEIEHERGRQEAALEHFRAALQILERTMRPDHPEVAALHNSVGRTLLALRRWDEAIASLEQAIAIWDASKLEHGAKAQARFALARALWDSRRDRRRAIVLAKQARVGFPDPADQAEVDTWLGARR